MLYIVYIDETGDHSLTGIDRDFPVFCLTMLIFDHDEYIYKAIPRATKLKMDYWGHENVILHSRDIRKAQGDFAFLTNSVERPPFYERINELMQDTNYLIISIVIDKLNLTNQYVYADNPYKLSLKFALERLLSLLEEKDQKEVMLVAESRGKKEDDDLRLSFLTVTNHGTEYVSKDRFCAIKFNLEFVSKKSNCTGTQMADLAGYPIARHNLNPNEPNPAYEIVRAKEFRGKGLTRGFKVFP